MSEALLVIDLQNDYFKDGKFPLWHSEEICDQIVKLIENAKSKNIAVIHIQHIADKGMGIFFEEGSQGAEIHPLIKQAAADAPVVIKKFADSFHQTTLEEVLASLNVEKLYICGMMTQNCVTHTAISKVADKYSVAVISDCCTTVSEILHLIALHALSTRVALITASQF